MIDKKFLDKEYSTCFLKEVDILAEHGIKYVFVKTDENGVRSYKYTKTKELFKILSNFYK